MTRKSLLLVPLLALVAACDAAGDPAKALDECQFEARKTLPQIDHDNVMSRSNPQLSGFIAACMSSKGFARNGGAKDCMLTDEEWQVACYKAK
jgi:hypothetical protein